MQISSITATQQALAEKKTSVEDVLQHFQQAEKKLNKKINAHSHSLQNICKQQWQAQQLSYQQQPENYSLLGAIITVKNNICIRATTTDAGSSMLQNFIAPYHATVAEKLVNQGAFIIAKTNMDPMGMGSRTYNTLHGHTLNPWNTALSAGGSSGGAAASVAAGLCHVALGTDSGGSIRQPAAWCGLCGLRPTYSTVSRHGLIALVSSMDQIGPVAYRAADCAKVMNVIAGADPVHDSSSIKHPINDYSANLNTEIQGLRIGICKNWDCCQQAGIAIKPDIKQAYQQLINWLKQQGSSCTNIKNTSLMRSLASYKVICCVEATSNLARYDGIRYGLNIKTAKNWQEQYKAIRSQAFEPAVQQRILLGTALMHEQKHQALYQQAQLHRQQISKQYQEQFKQLDLIITLSTPSTALPIDNPNSNHLYQYCDLFAVEPSLANLPALSFCIGYDENGLPIGAQCIGPAHSEARLLQLAAQYQLAHPEHLRRPAIFYKPEHDYD